MKIIIAKDKPIVECSYEEGIKIIKELLKDRKEVPIPTPKKTVKRKFGSGNYPHKKTLTDEEEFIVKKIHETYPQRTSRSIAEELNTMRIAKGIKPIVTKDIIHKARKKESPA